MEGCRRPAVSTHGSPRCSSPRERPPDSAPQARFIDQVSNETDERRRIAPPLRYADSQIIKGPLPDMIRTLLAAGVAAIALAQPAFAQEQRELPEIVQQRRIMNLGDGCAGKVQRARQRGSDDGDASCMAEQ